MDYNEAIKMEREYWTKIFQNAKELDYQLIKRKKNPRVFWDDPKIEKLIRGKYHYRIIHPNSKKPLRILELGCGLGRFSLELCRQNHNIDAYDISEVTLQLANSYYKFLKMKSNNFGSINYEVKDLNKIILPKKTYDLIFCHDSMHHILNSKRLINQAYTSLKNGGKFVTFDHIGQKSNFILKINKTMNALMDLQYLDNLYVYFLRKLKKKKKLVKKNKITKNVNSNSINKKKKILYSPFEDITGKEMIKYFIEIFGRNNIKFETTIALSTHWLVKIPGPCFIRYPVARIVKLIDDILIRKGFFEGEYIYLEAIKKS